MVVRDAISAKQELNRKAWAALMVNYPAVREALFRKHPSVARSEIRKEATAFLRGCFNEMRNAIENGDSGYVPKAITEIIVERNMWRL